jgi:hypothetical protein
MYFIKKQKYFNDHVVFSSPGRSASEKKIGGNHTRYKTPSYNMEANCHAVERGI